MTAQDQAHHRPVVGIVATIRTVDLHGLSFEAHGVFDSYLRRVAAAGGLPVVLPALGPDRAGELVAAVDALVLTGGVDLHPDCYGGVPVEEPMGGSYDRERDRFEIALIHAARSSGTPVLGVCRGLHVLNVAAGGTLVEHVGDHLGVRHQVAISSSSTLTGIMGGSVETGSLHHQAVGRVGAGLRTVATAPDGVVEALEATDGSAVLGVQWHPELEDGPAGVPLWQWVVEAAGSVR